MPQARESIFKNPIWVTPPWACAIAWWVASAVSFIGSACWIRLVIHWSSYYSGRLKNPMAHGMPSFNSLILESAGSAVFFAALGFWMYGRAKRKWQTHIRRRMGLCSACGYDLRFSPDRCPECGKVITRRVAAATPLP